MTDRYNAFIVVLEKEIREDDAEKTIDAIKQIKGVSTVTGHVSSMIDAIAATKAKRELSDKLWKVLEDEG